MSGCFLGCHSHSIDTQRRVAIPRDWRFKTGDTPTVFYLLPGRHESIQVLPKDLFEKEILEKASKVSFANAQKSRALARIGSKAVQSTCDKQGRISMTQDLLDHAGLKDQAMLIGGVTHIQIMTAENWAKSEMNNDEMLDEIERIQDAGQV